MSIQRAILDRTKSYALGVKTNELIQQEAYKGCILEIATQPVQLEPQYIPPHVLRNLSSNEQNNSIPIISFPANELLRCQSLISTKHDLQWIRSERFLKQLTKASHRIGFEIYGNRDNIQLNFLIHQNDLQLLKLSFEGEYPDCQIINYETAFIKHQKLFFYDFFPFAPYHHLQTEPANLQISPYESFIKAIANLSDSSVGFIQVLFEKVKHNWHQNIELLNDLEFMSKSIIDANFLYRNYQLPSGELRSMTREGDTKAHFDKPLYFTALRCGIITDNNHIDTLPFTSFVDLFHRDGQPFQFLTEQEYSQHFDHKTLLDMLNLGMTYRPGFLTNSLELSSMVHLPDIKTFVESGIPIKTHEILSIPKHDQNFSSGTIIGSGWREGIKTEVCINTEQRTKSVHIIGRPGSGKTTTMEYMIMQDIYKGQGLAYIDPHGDSVKKIANLIPKEKIETTIYLDLGDPKWIPSWNPLQLSSLENIGRTADDLVGAIKSIVKGNAWGDRLEHILRNSFYGLLSLPDTTFFDLLIILEQSSKKENKRRTSLKNRIIKTVGNQAVRLFWERDFDGYRRDDFAPPLHKLSKLLSSDDSIALMLSQLDSHINLYDIVESQKNLLIDLSNLGSYTREILGCFLLSFLHNICLSRSKMNPDARNAYSIYCDEAHKLTTDTLDHMIVESRKYGINMTLAHQYLNQFNLGQKDALGNIDTSIIFNVDMNDARFFVKDLQNKVDVNDIITLKRGQAITKIGTDIIKLETPGPILPLENSNKFEIMKHSHLNYCQKASDIKNVLLKKNNHDSNTSSSITNFSFDNGKPMIYDEFK